MSVPLGVLQLAPHLLRVAGGDDAREPGDGEGDASLVLVGVALDEGVDEGDGGGDDAHVLVVQQVDDARGPLAARDDVAVGAEEAQQAQRGGLFHHVESITARTNSRGLRTLGSLSLSLSLSHSLATLLHLN